MKTRRHAKILEIIKEIDVDTQEELLKYLRDAGYDVTQATVSRDIKELRLIKTLSRNGNSTGNESAGDISSKFYSLFADSVNSVESAQNMVVIKTPTGMAQAVCAAMDSMPWQNFIGTLAGDDTIFIVCRNEAAALETQEEFRKLIANR